MTFDLIHLLSCCSVVGKNQGDFHEETLRRINALDVSEGKKIRYKVVLALNQENNDLYDPRRFDELPLELMVSTAFLGTHLSVILPVTQVFFPTTSHKAIPLGDDSARTRCCRLWI